MQTDFLFQPRAFDDISLLFFLFIGGVMVASALGTVLCRNPLNSVLCLVTNLLGVAALYASLHAHFLAAAQVIVYAGAIVVLFLFVVMLLNVKDEKYELGSVWLRAGACSSALGFVLLSIMSLGPQLTDWSEPRAIVAGSVKGIGEVLFRDYVFLFEVVSLVLLAAMAGAVMLARKRSAPKEGIRQK